MYSHYISHNVPMHCLELLCFQVQEEITLPDHFLLIEGGK